MKVCERSDGGEQRGDGGFDVDQLWMWCFVCAAVTPRSGRKMRKGPFFLEAFAWLALHPRPERNKAPASADCTDQSGGAA